MPPVSPLLWVQDDKHLQPLLTRLALQSFHRSPLPFFAHFLLFDVLLIPCCSKLHTEFQMRPHQCFVKRVNPFSWLDAARIQLALLATRAHCRLTFSLPSTLDLFPLSLQLPDMHPGLHHSRCRIQHLLLLNFILQFYWQLSRALIHQHLSARPFYPQGNRLDRHKRTLHNHRMVVVGRHLWVHWVQPHCSHRDMQSTLSRTICR